MRIRNALIAAGLAVTATACGPVEDMPETTSRSVELTDATGQSRVTVVLTGEAAALDQIDLAGLMLTARADGIDAFQAIEAVAAEAERDEELPGSQLTVEVVDEQLADGVDAIDIVETRAPAWRAPFAWRYRYSELDCVDVTRTSFWHKVYVSIWSKDTSVSDWSSMVLNRKLSNNETLHRCEEGSYKLKVGVEARNTDHYNIAFDD